jgi:hypothetical protein
MRLWCLLVAGILASTAPASRASAQSSPTSSSDATASSGASDRAGAVPKAGEGKGESSGGTESSPSTDKLQLPVSLDKIRDQLARPPVEALKGLDDTATFRVVIQEHQKFQDLISSLRFETGGPAVPGGRDMYEQQQRLFPSVSNPRAQPYAAYTQGELLQVLITSMIERYFAGRVVSSITDAERANAEARARAEASRSIADYCVAQPGGGAGIKICDAK